MNANDFFNNRDGVPKPVYRFSTFGFNVGGPIYFPGKFNTEKKKLFFFYSQENWGVKLPQDISHVTVPTAAERLGDFSNTLDEDGKLRVIKDPATGQPFPNNMIPPGRINHDAQLMLNIMPLPNQLDRSLTGGNYNFEWQDNVEIPKMLNALKVDFHPTEKDHFSFLPRRWRSDTRAYQSTIGYGGVLPIWKHHYYYLTDSVVMTWTRTISPTKVNEFSSGFTGEREQGQPKNLFGRTVENYFDPIRRVTLGYQGGQLFPEANPYNIIPSVFFDGVPNQPGLGSNGRLPDDQGYSRFHLTDNFSWIRGAHTLKFGLYFERSWANDGPEANCFNGCFNFGRDVNNPGDTGWAFSNALLGNFQSYYETNARPRYQGTNKIVEWFAQDTWKATRKLTLTYGMRFSWFTPWYMSKGTGATFQEPAYDPSQVPPPYRPVLNSSGNRVAQDPATGQLYPEVYIGAFAAPSYSFPGSVLTTDPGYPKGFRKQQAVQPMPRFGFAYDLFGDGKTAIRGGFAIMKQASPSYSTYISIQNNPPVKYSPQIFYGNMSTFLRQSGLLYPTGTSTFDPNDTVPSIYRYSLGIQRELGLGTVIDASYVGNVGRHLIQGYDPNEVPYGAHFQPQNIDPTTGTALPDDFYRPIAGYNSIYTVITSGSSSYNALQVAINRRYSHGASFGLSYTWSKVMGTAASSWGGGAAVDIGPVATYRPWRVWNYGPASFDQTQMLVINYVWDLPKLSRIANNAVVRQVFDNWQVAGVTTFSSGLPYPIYPDTTDGADIAGGGDGWRPMLIGQPHLSRGNRTFNRWFNTAAFGRPPQGYYGDAPILPVRGPGMNNWDLTLMKQFRLWNEASRLQFRCEMYNAFNHPNFTSMDTYALFDETGKLANPTFGQINGARSARVIQLSVRFTF